MSNSQSLQELFSSHDSSDDKILASALAPTDFKLDWQPGSRHPTLQAIPSERTSHQYTSESPIQPYVTKTRNDAKMDSVQPVEYSLLIGFPLCLGLIIMITSFGFMHHKSINDDGRLLLPRKR